MGNRLVVQFARGSRRNETYPHQERTIPRPRRTPFRMQISGLPFETSWQVSSSLYRMTVGPLDTFFEAVLSFASDHHHNYMEPSMALIAGYAMS